MIDDDDRALLVRMGLADDAEDLEFEPLTGGVSSDIRLVRISGRTVVLKRALTKLKVEADWRAPIERGQAEARWLAFAGTVVPDAVPRVLATDAETFAIALEYLPPDRYRNWKSALLSGDVDPTVAAAVGQVAGRVHAASAAASGLAAAFANQTMFESLRIEPYLRRSATAVPEAADALAGVIALLEAPGGALVHGDLSPKNILIGPTSPVILDAECATWSDPAFDAAFCLTHLELKAEVLPGHAPELRTSAEQFRAGYIAEVDWEDPAGIDERISRIVPALMLARVAGASPVEYLDASARARVLDRAITELNSSSS